jgi:hypothetical protein
MNVGPQARLVGFEQFAKAVTAHGFSIGGDRLVLIV